MSKVNDPIHAPTEPCAPASKRITRNSASPRPGLVHRTKSSKRSQLPKSTFCHVTDRVTKAKENQWTPDSVECGKTPGSPDTQPILATTNSRTPIEAEDGLQEVEVHSWHSLRKEGLQLRDDVDLTLIDNEALRLSDLCHDLPGSVVFGKD